MKIRLCRASTEKDILFSQEKQFTLAQLLVTLPVKLCFSLFKHDRHNMALDVYLEILPSIGMSVDVWPVHLWS